MSHKTRQKRHGGELGQHIIQRKNAAILSKRHIVPLDEQIAASLIGKISALPNTPYCREVASRASGLLKKGELAQAAEIVENALKLLQAARDGKARSGNGNPSAF
jgi:hypothetical protein